MCTEFIVADLKLVKVNCCRFSHVVADLLCLQRTLAINFLHMHNKV